MKWTRSLPSQVYGKYHPTEESRPGPSETVKVGKRMYLQKSFIRRIHLLPYHQDRQGRSPCRPAVGMPEILVQSFSLCSFQHFCPAIYLLQLVLAGPTSLSFHLDLSLVVLKTIFQIFILCLVLRIFTGTLHSICMG